MSADTRIVPIEATHAIPVLVQKLRFDGENLYHHPNTTELGGGAFQSFEGAFEYAASDQTKNYYFEAILPYIIDAELRRLHGVSTEILQVTVEQNTGYSPRSVEGHHAVSTNYADMFTIAVVNAGSPQILDRGLAWVDVNEKPAHFGFTVLGSERGWPKSLDADLKLMLKRTSIVLNDLVVGMMPQKSLLLSLK